MQDSVEPFEKALKNKTPIDEYLFSSRNHVFTLTWRGEKIAVKIPITPEGEQQLSNEIDILKELSHPNIVGFRVDAKEKKVLGMEFLDDHDLGNVFNYPQTYNLSSDDRKYILHGVASAFDYLHKRRIVFNDVKPENILLGGWRNRRDIKVKVADFGLSFKLELNETKRVFDRLRGSAEYLSPEMLTKREGSMAGDVYGYGCVAYELLKGVQVFSGTFLEEREFQNTHGSTLSEEELRAELASIHIQRVYRAVFSGLRAPFAYGVDGPADLIYSDRMPEIPLEDEAQRLIRSCWANTPELRPSFKAVLAHGFFGSFCTLNLESVGDEEDNLATQVANTKLEI